MQEALSKFKQALLRNPKPWLKLAPQGAGFSPDSLVFRAVAGLLAILAMISAAMFFSIDGFVSQQFSRLHIERVTIQNGQVRQQIQSEMTAFEANAKLIATDTDLSQSAQYHLYLEGEIAPLKADINRIVGAFNLEWFAIMDKSGRLVATSNATLVKLGERLPRSTHAVLKASASLAWVDNKLWVIASAPIMAGEAITGWVQLGRQTSIRGSISDESLTLYPVSVTQPQPASSIRIPVWSPDSRIQALDVIVPDPAREVLARTKRVIALTLLTSAVLLGFAIVFYLRRLLAPVRQLTAAVGDLPLQLEKGQLFPLEIGGQGEVRQLVGAFNGMIHHLSRLRQFEAEVHAQEKLSAVGRVAMRVAHDLNNPMTVIKNTAHLLKPELQDKPELLAEIDLILHYCARCSSTIDNLLRFGKPAKLKFETIELGACMLSYRESLKHRHTETRFNLILLPGGPYLTRGDHYQLEQMVDNLLDNALEANDNQEVEVVIGAEADGRYFMRFTDYGKGFQGNEAENAFELFFTTKQTGTGLGLSNARAIAQAHGGDIQITDPANGGVTVWLKPSSLSDFPRAVRQ